MARPARLAVALLAVAALFAAGCASPAAPAPSSGAAAVAAALPEAFSATNDASGCQEAVGILLVDPAQAQKALPKGWVADDAGNLLGTPPTGKAGIWFSGYNCTTSSMAGKAWSAGEFGVLVKAPTLVGAKVPAASVQVYLLSKTTDAAPEKALLNGTGFPIRMDNVAVRTGLRVPAPVPAPSAPVPGAGRVTNGNRSAPYYSLSFQAVPADPLTAHADFWSQTPGGLVLYQYDVNGVATQKGAVTQCAFGPGIPKDTAGETACQPANAVVLLASAEAWKGTIDWIPGAHVAS